MITGGRWGAHGWLGDPGPCPVDDAPHTTCTSGGPLVIVQMPCRDALMATAAPPAPVAPLRAETIQAALPPGSFTTGTYRRKKKS